MLSIVGSADITPPVTLKYRAEKIYGYIVVFGPNKKQPTLCDVSVAGTNLHWYGVQAESAIGIVIAKLKTMPRCC